MVLGSDQLFPSIFISKYQCFSKIAPDGSGLLNYSGREQVNLFESSYLSLAYALSALKL